MTIPMMRRLRLLATALTMLLLLAACSGGDDTAADTDTADSAATAVEDSADADRAAATDDGQAFAPSGSAGAGEDEAADAEAPAQPDAQIPPVDTSTGTAATGERIIKEGTVTLVVEAGQFDAAFSQVVSRAQALGGHVSGTASSTDPAPGRAGEDGEVLTTGQVTIRIPVRNFEDLLTAVGDAGRITDRNVTSQDVTAEYTDLASRRRNLQAQERFYLGLLDQAQTVQDAVAVQQQLQGLQEQIEQITGRLNLLADRTAFSTLTVRITEEGAAELTPFAEDDEPGGLTPYLEEAADVLVATVGAIIVVSTFLLPFVVLALMGYAVWRSVRRDRSAPAPSAAVPPPPAEPAMPVGVGAPEEEQG